MKRTIIFLSLGLFFLIGFAFDGDFAHAAVIGMDSTRISGLRGLYYDTTGDPITRDERNSDIAAMRTDPTISFRWNDRTPPPAPSDFFTAEWKGDLAPPTTGTYAFTIISDGAAALWINDDLLIEGAPSELTRRTEGAYEYTHTPGSFFEVGRTYHLRIKTRHSRINGLAQLWWRTPNGMWEIVPSAYFSTDNPASPLPTGSGTGVSTAITQYVGDKTYRVSRTDPTVQIDLPTDFQNKGSFRFDVSWSGEIQPRLSTFYRFYASTDGPVAFSLHGEDGDATFSTSSEGPGDVRTDSVFLLAGKRYPFTMTYHQESGVARARLLWSNALQPNKELIPRAQLYAPLRAQQQPKKQGSGLAGQYYNGEHFEQRAFSRLDPTINFNWKKSSPKPGPIRPNHFSIKWEGEVEAQKTDFYQFSSKVDDRIKLTLDGTVLLDTLPVRAGKTNHALPVLLESGRRYPVSIEYAQYIDTSYVNLLWSSSDGRRGVVPQEALYGSLAPRLKGVGLRGDYFDGENFQTLKARHPAEAVNFLWGTQAPDLAIPSDHFSVRWTGWIEAPENGTYTLTTRVDDGVRLWIGGKGGADIAPGTPPLIDKWLHVPNYLEEYSAEKTFEAGQRYPVRIEYFEYDGPTGIQLFWTRKNKAREIVPTIYLYPSAGSREAVQLPGNGAGLRGRYYTGADTAFQPALPLPIVERTDPFIDVNWGKEKPHDSIPADDFSVMWEGFIQPQYSGVSTFYLLADDGATLYIDESPITTATKALLTTGSERREYSAPKNLSRDHLYYIRLVYRENIGDASVHLSWSHARIPKEVVPRSQLYSPTMSILAPLGVK